MLGISNDALAIAIAIGGSALAIFLQLRNETTKLKNTYNELATTSDFLKRLNRNQVHEKIAVLNRTVLEISEWKDTELESKRNQLTANVRAITEVKPILTGQQREQLHVVRTRIIDAMKPKYAAAEVDAVFEELFLP